jgi:glutathione S-transferase
MTIKLHNFFRSSTSIRLRAALNLKGITYDYVPYVLRRGDTRKPEFLRMNPAGLVPVMEREDGRLMTQSLAIIEWLEETQPEPALLPENADGRARVRLYAQVWNNRRFDIALDRWPTIARIFTALDAIPAFRAAAPPYQPDAA